MEPYSFHCTPCGFSHAGDCKPKVTIKVEVDVDSAKKAITAVAQIAKAVQLASNPTLPSGPSAGGAVTPAPYAYAPSPFLSPGTWPVPHTMWRTENSVDGGKTWQPTGFVYEIDSFDMVHDTITIIYPGGGKFIMVREMWNQSGSRNMNGGLSRFVRHP